MIEVRGLSKIYNNMFLYKDFNIIFDKGRVTALMGPSGGGKTTLLRMLAGLEKYEKGSILGLKDEKIAMVFQEDRLLDWLSVYDNVRFVLKSYLTEEDARKRIEKMLKIVEIWEYRDYAISSLSGGMQRRVAIARALAYESSTILMDEPFKGLDVELKDRIVRNINILWEQDQKTVIFITHNSEEAVALSAKIYELRKKPVKLYNI